jgi:hypothetical protein
LAVSWISSTKNGLALPPAVSCKSIGFERIIFYRALLDVPDGSIGGNES